MSRVLIATLPPFEGGVPAKTRILAEELRRCGHQVTIAHYAPMSSHGHLSVPSWRLATGGRPQCEAGTCFGGTFPSWAVGCRLPELEFTYYRPSEHWAKLAAEHDRHIAVGGTVLISLPFTRLGLPHLVWCACDMLGDRLARRAAMPPLRRWFDRLVVGPVQARMEREILDGPAVISTVSDYGRRMLSRLAAPGRSFGPVMPIPVDTDALAPATEENSAVGVVGFAGRMSDPRKNVGLLVEAISLARRRNPSLRLRLTGEPVAGIGGEGIEWSGILSPGQLPDFYRSLDLFVIPSSQEGFAIVGMEAMAAGVPVISTRCGGPEDYVVDGLNGYLCDTSPQDLADRLLAVIGDRALRQTLGRGARESALRTHSHAAFRAVLEADWRAVWGETP